MRLKTFFICLAVCVFGFFAGVFMGTLLFPQEEYIAAQSNPMPVLTLQPLPTESLAPTTPLPTATAQNRHLLTLSDDGISVYKMLSDGKTALIYKTNVDIRQLRREDYEALCRGIVVNSEEEARALTEDFGS